MNVRQMQEGAPGGWVPADAFRVDDEGSVWVDLDAPVQAEADPEEDLIQIRRNRELVADQTGLKLGSEHLIEVPAERLARRQLARLDAANRDKWGPVTLWKPWSYSWTLKSLPTLK